MPSFPTTATALAAATLLTGTAALAATAVPASRFTDSIGVNLHLEYTDTYYYSKQSTVETLLRDARIRHVRSRVLSADLAQTPGPGTNSNPTNSVALLARAGVKTVMPGASLIRSLYLDTVNRQERTTSNGWTDNFDVLWANADKAQAWWDTHAPGTARIAAVEGVNEPNLRWGATCANWLSKTADFQHRMNVVVDALPRIANALRVGPSLVHSSTSLCADGPSKDPFRSLGRHTAPTGTGFTVAWNAGWTAPVSPASSPAWFSASPGSVAATVDVANLHIYPAINDTPENSLKSAFWVAGGVNKCDGPAAPSDPGPGATGFSCAHHAARLDAASQPKPVWVTEAGYQIVASGVTERTRGIYLPRLLLSYFQAGIARTYLYELMQGKPNSQQADRWWLAPGNGALDTSYGYHALRRLQWAIGNGDLPAGEAPGSLDLTVAELGQPGVPADPAFPVRHILFQEADGSYSLALWPTDKVANGTQDITPPQRRVRITLGGGAKRFSLHPIDPQSTVDIVAGQLISASAVQAEVVLSGGHAVVVKLR